MTVQENQTFAEQLAAMLDSVRPGLDDLKKRASRAGGEERQFLNQKLAALRDREQAIRHQLDQLDDASGAALQDLEHGLLIAWERYARDVAQVHKEHPAVRNAQETVK